VRRRSRKVNDVRSKIRLRVWLACTGALLVMTIAIYWALERQRSSESSHLLGAPATTIAAA